MHVCACVSGGRGGGRVRERMSSRADFLLSAEPNGRLNTMNLRS